MKNILLNTDSYKTSHYSQYPEGAKRVHSYIEARGSTIPEVQEVTFFGLQTFLREYLSTGFTKRDIQKAEALLKAHGAPFNAGDWHYIRDRYNGKLPVTIKALPEGTTVPVGTPLVTVENNDLVIK